MDNYLRLQQMDNNTVLSYDAFLTQNNNKYEDLPQQLIYLISLVPEHQRKYIQFGIFIIPTDKLIGNYFEKKAHYIDEICKTRQPSSKSIHKFTSVNPLTKEEINQINARIVKYVNLYYSLFLPNWNIKQQQHCYSFGFAVTYNKGQKGLAPHTDESIYTVNICLSSNALGNQVVFNGDLVLVPEEDYAYVHTGKIPHYTNNLVQGQRTNIVLWFK